LLILDFFSTNVVAIAKNLIESQQSCGHAAAAAQKRAAIHPLPARCALRDFGQFGLELHLFGRLRRWNEFFVRSNSGWDRGPAFDLRIKLALAYPHSVYSWREVLPYSPWRADNSR